MSTITDIVVTTRKRLEYLKPTIEHILTRTRTPFALHVIDDASCDETTDYLIDMYRCGLLANLVLRGQRVGQMANLNVGGWLSFSDPTVLTDDDVLCPDVEPDWLARGLEAMEENRELGILALNHPGARRREIAVKGPVTYCRFIGGTFMFVRRKILETLPLPHFRNNFGSTPTMRRCHQVVQAKYRVGYLTDTYCYHIGEKSIITDGYYKGVKSIEPDDWDTLEPPL